MERRRRRDEAERRVYLSTIGLHQESLELQRETLQTLKDGFANLSGLMTRVIDLLDRPEGQ